jgi:hypothetical protein
MKTIFPFIALCIICTNMNAQTPPNVPKEALRIFPALQNMHGYAVGHYNQCVLIIGGRTKSDVPELYAGDFPNLEMILIDLNQRRATAFGTGNLEGVLGEHLAATGMAYYQHEHLLYLVGGYGYSDSQCRFITFPYLTVIDLKATLPALLAGQNPVAHFYQISDKRLALFDATFDYNGDEFFIINGKYAYKLNPFEDKPTYHEENRTGEGHTFRLQQKEHQIDFKDFKSWYDLRDLEGYYGPLLPERIERAIHSSHKGNQ